MRRVVHFLSLATLTALLVPALEAAAAAPQKPRFSEETRFLPPLATVSTAEVLLEMEPLRLGVTPLQFLAQADGRQSEAERLFEQGLEQFNRSQFHEAIATWEQLLTITRDAGYRQAEGIVLNALGEAYRNLSQYERAIALYEEALTIAREIGDRSGESLALGNLGLTYDNLGNYERAIDLYQQALPLYHSVKDSLGEWKTLLAIGNAYSQLDQYYQAIEQYQKALNVSQEIGNAELTTISLLSLGHGNSAVDNHDVAISFFQRALTEARDMRDAQYIAQSLNGLAGSYNEVDNYKAAIEALEESLEIARRINDPELTSSSVTALAWSYNFIGHHEQAISLYQQNLDFARHTENLELESVSLTAMGWAYYSLGNFERALELHEEALMIAAEIDETYPELVATNHIAFALSALGRYQEAITFHQRALSLANRVGSEEAKVYSYNDLGKIYESLGDFASAIDYYLQSIILASKIRNYKVESSALADLASLMKDFSQPELAILFYKKSLNIREGIRRNIGAEHSELQTFYIETIADDYRALADLLLQENRVLEAQRVLDLLKVQELDDYIRGVERTSETETGVDFLRPEESILSRYDDLQESAIAAGQELGDLKAIPEEERSDEQVQRIAQLTDLLDGINSDFRDFARSPEIRSLIDQLSYEAQEASLSLNQLDRLRDELQQLNAAIFYPLILEDRLELVITVPDSPPLRRTVDVSREELNAAILEFRTALTNPRSDAKIPAQQLYDWLVRPLEADLAAAGVETIIYSPDGQLRYIPLAALHDGESWLIQQYQVNNITAESLTDLTESNTPQPKILAAAYADESLVHSPEVNGTIYTFRGLPGAGLEVDLLPTETKYFDTAFSLEAVRPILDEYSILHFATHAAFVPGVPEDSFILFGNGDTPTLRDVEDWSLNGVDLVVLSACETGVGGLGNGEEILGLGYQFQVSGAKAVMSSLWKVSDNGTQVLMAEFYAALMEDDMTKAEALQIAQTALITGKFGAEDGGDRAGAPPTNRDRTAATDAYPGYSHPYYWAPFILIGNGQ